MTAICLMQFLCHPIGFNYANAGILIQAFSRILLSYLCFQFFSAFFGVQFNFIGKISQNYTGLRCLRDIKGLTQQAKGAGVLAAYCCGEGREGIVLFNDALNTFYLRLYGVRHMGLDHSDSEIGNPLPPHGLLFSINSKGSFICTIPQTG